MTVIRPATDADLPAVKALCALVLPHLVKTNSTPWDSRFGSGRTWQDPLLLVAVGQGGELVGFAAASPAFLQDHGLPVPWWCLDLVAVQPAFQGQHIGETLVLEVLRIADQAGVSSLYGLCDPDLTGWYAHLGFTTTGPGAVVDTNVRVKGDDEDMSFAAPEDQCFILTDICDDPLPRLFIQPC